MEKITKIKHNNGNSNRKNQTSVLMVAVLIAVAIAVVAGPTLEIIIQEAHATTCTTKITCYRYRQRGCLHSHKSL